MPDGFAEAVYRISVAAEDHSTSLDLSLLDLDALPPSLAALTGLTELHLNGNGLTALPDWIGSLTGLATLRLDDNALTDLPEALSTLTNLTEFYLDYNRLAQLPDWLGSLSNLTTLHLDSNQLIALPDTIGSLANLTELRLSRNKLIALPASIGSLSRLGSLHLDGNQLTALPDTIGSLASLTTLDANGNRLVRLPDSIGSLFELATLCLNDNRLTALPEAIGSLANLTTLLIDNNPMFFLPEAICSLTALARLDADGNKLAALPRSVGALTNLTTLYLQGNRLASLPDSLSSLTNLTELYLSDNQLAAVPEPIRALANLSELHLDYNGLTALPDWLGNLAKLTRLSLAGNRLSSLPDSLSSLRDLAELRLNDNELSELPDWLGDLTKLTGLYLDNNRLVSLPDALGGLASLTGLYLDNNRLTELPEAIDALTNLSTLCVQANRLVTLPVRLGALPNIKRLDLDGNELTDLPDTLAGSTTLATLYLQENQLTVLPDWLGTLPNLTTLHVGGNRLTSPPAEIAASGSEAVLAFLRDLSESEAARSWASKLLVVGEAAVGKTSLAKLLVGKVYDPDEGQTHGIHVDPLFLEHPTEPGVTMTLKLWDFGGQLEYRATQRFYLTNRSLFVLVWNARTRWRDGKLTAWLNVITARAPESPILIVATHGDDASPAPLPADIVARYPQIVGTFTIDSKSGSGIHEVREAIRRESADLPLMGARWPASWVAAADAVRTLQGDAVTARAVWQTMTAAGVRDPQAHRAIIRALHDLGDVVYFEDDPELNRRVILRPEWLERRITQVLDSPQVVAAHGVLARAECDRLWADLDDPDLQERLLRMMERFDLAYRIGDADLSEHVALVVDRLDDACPPEVNERWRMALDGPGIREIGIIYKLRSRQAGIPIWFIARQHRYTTGLHWAHGVLLHDRDPRNPAYALLVDDEREQPTITLRVRARYPVHLMSVLVETFENIVKHRYPRLIEQRLVRCCCQAQNGGLCDYTFDLDDLTDQMTDPDSRIGQEVRCPRSRTWIDARMMLDGLPGSGINARLDQLARTIADHTKTLSRIDQRQLDTLNSVRLLLARRTQTGVHCPSLFAVEDLGRKGRGHPRRLKVSLWCEWPYAPDGPHPLPEGQGEYILNSMPAWLRDYLPFLHGLAATLAITVPMISPSLIALGMHLSDRTRASFEASGKLLNAVGGVRGPDEDTALWNPLIGQGPTRYAEVGADFRALRNALRSMDPQEVWGGLSAVPRPEDRNIVYLCREHAIALDYPYRSRQQRT